MADIGYITLFLAFIASIYSAFTFAIGGRNKNPRVVESAHNAMLVVFGLVTIAVAGLLYSLLIHDFQIKYVADYSSRDMSPVYIFSALWAGNSGSLLIWAWLLAIFAVIFLRPGRRTGRELVPYASAVTMLTTAFFLILMVKEANPFEKLSFAPADGTGLNPLLENPGMLIHPVTVLAGYVGLTIPFSFAVAALLTKRLDNEWVHAVRTSTLVTWLLLGIGNVIGAWWAYVELGWGGYWGWDPVENASLMPWLIATAFVHSLSMQKKRGIFKVWNMVLILIAFNLAIFGTFLTRSGILSSVHAFPNTGLAPFFVSFMAIAIIVPIGLIYSRQNHLKDNEELDSLVSRESTFLLNNLIFVGAALAVLLGTLFPLFTKITTGNEATVGPSFFNTVDGPLFMVIILLAGICTIIGWRHASGKNLLHNLIWPIAAGLVTLIVLLAFGMRSVIGLVSFPVCVFVLGTIVYELFRGTKGRNHALHENYFKAFWNLIGSNRPRYGGYIVHFGIVVFTIGVLASSLFNVEKEVTLKPGESASIGKYNLNYINLTSDETPTRSIVKASLSVFNGNTQIGMMNPEKIFHVSQEQPVTEVAIRSNLREDLYVILIGWEQDQTAAFQLIINPLVAWLWIGGGILVVGGLIAFWPQPERKIGVRK